MTGLAQDVIAGIDWLRVAANIQVDVRSDFVLAPHLDLIYRNCSEELADRLVTLLRNGNYQCQLPITMSVPKQGQLTRPGSILLPYDRLLYQALIENMLPSIEQELDRTRTFSHVPSDQADRLFENSFIGWSNFQNAVQGICRDSEFVLVCDVANYFETLPQHTLVNSLRGAGCTNETVRLTEEMLLAFRQRSSQGIIQGLYPSDVMGNYYLADIDARLDLEGLPSARYVDDFVVGFNDEISARSYLVRLSEHFRSVGLALNPVKTGIMRSDALLYTETEVDNLFDAARDSIAEAREIAESGGYGFQGDWVNSDELEDAGADDLELIAVRALLNYETDSAELREKIERFALPYLRAAGDDAGVEYAFSALDHAPHLTRQCFSYLNYFARRDIAVQQRIEERIQRNGFYLDYQRMYHIAGILNCQTVSNETVAQVMSWFRAGQLGEHTKAMAVIFCGKFGSARLRRELRESYSNESPYVRAAMLYSSQFYTAPERRTMRTAWSGHSDLNSLISQAL